MEFEYFKEKDMRFFVVRVIEALTQKQGAFFQAIANQLTEDLKTNLNRANRLATKVNNAHALGVVYERT